jgi:hypothetical protein
MGGKGMLPKLKEFAQSRYPRSRSDLFAMFIERGFDLCFPSGLVAMVTMQNWMFLSSYEQLREEIIVSRSILNLVQIGYDSFPEMNSKIAQACAFCCSATSMPELVATFCDLNNLVSQSADKGALFVSRKFAVYHKANDAFRVVPGYPIAYWLSDQMLRAFANGVSLGAVAPARQGLATADNDRFVRAWQEVDVGQFGLSCTSRAEAATSGKRWFPYNKGGDFRKWYGNQEYCVNWKEDGYEIRHFTDDKGKVRSRPQNMECYFQESISWSDITSSTTSFRHFPVGFIYDVTGMSAFAPNDRIARRVLGFCNSAIATSFTKALNPTLHFQIGNYQTLPFVDLKNDDDCHHIKELIELAKVDWNSYEASWEFQRLPLLCTGSDQPSIESAYNALCVLWGEQIQRTQKLEEFNNSLFINACGLQNELTSEVPLGEITLKCNPSYRYGGDLAVNECERRRRADAMRELLSYAVGCMMGRFSLDKPGLIYAGSGNSDFDPKQYETFSACDDGIIPLLDVEWGVRCDATVRLEEFVSAAWPKESLEANLNFIASSLNPANGEQAREVIRRYFAAEFYKHHLTTFQKRPIYWLFSSGKRRAFQCVVYLHRYNAGTLARMRTEYVIPLQGQITARVDQLETDKAKVSSSSQRRKLQKEQDDLKKKQAELMVFDENLKHFADQKTVLNLDDGVRVNYGKFGDLLAEVKAITGGKDDE